MPRVNPLLIGQAPSRTGDPSQPLRGYCGMKLASLFGISTASYLKRFDRNNLINHYPGKNGKGDFFDLLEARDRAIDTTIMIAIIPRPYVLLIGRNVARAFRKNQRYFERFDLHGSPAYVVPHPSGISRWWNEPGNRAKAQRFFKRLIREETK